MVNNIISYDPKSKSFNQNGILPTDVDENTFFIWTVKASHNDEFIIKFREEEFRFIEVSEARKNKANRF